MITDIHSHHLHDNQEEQIISLCFKDYESDLFNKAINISVGIHPWFLSEKDLEQQTEWVKYIARNDKRVMAIGECGTDRICSTPTSLQISAFKAMIGMSEELKLPLIIHSVKTHSEIISLKKQINPSQKWIIHGFRGKKEILNQLINHGIYISIGDKFNVETIKNIPKNMLLLETDESDKNIDKITEYVAENLYISSEELTKIITENTNSLFFKR